MGDFYIETEKDPTDKQADKQKPRFSSRVVAIAILSLFVVWQYFYYQNRLHEQHEADKRLIYLFSDTVDSLSNELKSLNGQQAYDRWYEKWANPVTVQTGEPITGFPSPAFVQGYQRQDGTRIDSYLRTSRDSVPDNNYSYGHNVNPHTGQKSYHYPDKPSAADWDAMKGRYLTKAERDARDASSRATDIQKGAWP